MKTFYFDNLNMKSESFSVLQKCAERVLKLRGCALVEQNADYTISVAIDTALTDDRYIISFKENGAEIKGATDYCVFAAFGVLLTESKFDGRGDFVPAPCGKQIDFTPKKKVRCIYFASHFHNFYHMAPIEKVYEVLEDIALYGCNCVRVWFDMHHYNAVEDADAQAMIQRLRQILKYANTIGMYGMLAGLSNEGFNSSPEHLRADWWKQGKYKRDIFHYHREICPSKPGGLAEILKEKRQALEPFKDLDIRYVGCGPYDQGGCTCPECEPWGINGYLKIYPAFKEMLKEVMPNAKATLGMWKFNEFIDGEWEGFVPLLGSELLKDVPFYAAYFPNGQLVPCLEESGMVGKVNFMEFSEISMYSCKPWGGFGASVLTGYMKKVKEKSEHIFSGGIAYSEGIYEDANKFIILSAYSGRYENPYDAIRDYVKTEFCCEDEELYQAVIKTETGLARTYDPTLPPPRRCVIHDTSDVEFVYNTFQKYNKILPENITKSRKFRLFYLRAVIDYALMHNDFYVKGSEECIKAMQEVDDIYYVCDETSGSVRTPLDRETYTELF